MAFALMNASIEHGWRGSSRIKPKKFSVNPRYPRHTRSTNPYTGLIIALVSAMKVMLDMARLRGGPVRPPPPDV